MFPVKPIAIITNFYSEFILSNVKNLGMALENKVMISYDLTKYSLCFECLQLT